MGSSLAYWCAAGRGAGDHAVGSGVVALSWRRPRPCRAGWNSRGRPLLHHRPARIGAAVRDPRCGGRGHCHRDRGFHHRHRLWVRRWPIGVPPGVVLAITLSALVWWRYRGEDLAHVEPAGTREVARSFIIALPALALPFVIRAAVVEGIATATEVSTIGIVYGFVVGLLVYRRFDWRRLLPMLIETACLSGAILLIIGTATGMAWGLTQSGCSRALAAAMTGLPGGSGAFIAVTSR